MCIMEVRPGQRSSTIAQAMAHNVSTIERDLDMFRPLVAARGETELLATIEAGHEALKVAYARFLECFVAEVEQEIANGGDHDHDFHDHERLAPVHLVDAEMIEQAEAVMRRDARAAERYETR